MSFLDKSLAFFDVDSLEYRPELAERRSVLPGFTLRERMMPIAGKLDVLHAHAQDRGHPMLFSICCSGRSPLQDELPDLPRIRAGIDDEKVPNDASRLYLVEKARTDHRQGDFIEAMHDKFRGNAQLGDFLKSFGARRWVVFGNGAAFCVHPALCCLFDAGQALTILTDVLIDSAGGYSSERPADLRLAMLASCAKRGATLQTFAEFCRQYGIASHESSSREAPQAESCPSQGVPA